ncbi:MAG: hypothetical protein ACRDJN_15570 [Chloroflexota bacterium]
MAQVATDLELVQRIEKYLEYLASEWQDVPAVAQEWNSWQEHERLDFVIEWPIREDRLHQLHQWAAQDRLTPAQRARYEDLLTLVAANRPTLERLLAE